MKKSQTLEAIQTGEIWNSVLILIPSLTRMMQTKFHFSQDHNLRSELRCYCSITFVTFAARARLIFVVLLNNLLVYGQPWTVVGSPVSKNNLLMCRNCAAIFRSLPPSDPDVRLGSVADWNDGESDNIGVEPSDSRLAGLWLHSFQRPFVLARHDEWWIIRIWWNWNGFELHTLH